jgi:hypothetical protein
MPRFALAIMVAVFLAGTAGAMATAGLERFERVGISFAYPSDWFVTARPLSNGSDPDYRFAVATWPVHRTSRDRGPCLAGIAQQRPANGALAFLREYVGASRKRALPRHPPKPNQFRLPTQRDGDFGCLGKGSLAHYFRDSGRALILWISIGPKATAETRQDLRQILASLEIRRRRCWPPPSRSGVLLEGGRRPSSSTTRPA